MALALCVLSTLGGFGESAQQPTPAEQGRLIQARFDADVKPLLKQHCFRCHGDGKSKGDLSLDRFSSLNSIQSEARIWRHMSDMLRANLMPPEDRPPLSGEQKSMLIQWIDDALDFCDCSGPRDPGRVAIHRLNRTEYNNTIRDLLAVDFQPAADFPADDTGYGFDNIADVLSMSPLLLEKYLAAAEQVMDKAIVTENPHRSRKLRIAGASMEGSPDQVAGGDLTVNGECFIDHPFIAEGEYEFRIRAYGQQFGDEPPKLTFKVGKESLKTFDVASTSRKPEIFTFRHRVKAGRQRVAAAYINNKVDNNNPDPKKRGDRNLYLMHVEIEGPFDAPPPPPPDSHKRIFALAPAAAPDEPRAKTIIQKFASRAFRRPATDAEATRLLSLYQDARSDGENFESAIKLALTGVLVSPHFLFRIEADPPGEPGAIHSISDLELATRLSYFLWSSMPDDELLNLAIAGKLRAADNLDRQIQRMLAHDRSTELVSNFVGQWLETRNLDDHIPDAKQFPSFDRKLASAMKREVEVFFEHIMRSDRSVLELLDADYTFLNERLAKHYGIPGVEGERMRQVNVSGTGRGGVLTMGGVLTVTAMPTRTSPVKRGKFILEQILGTPPPPPPPDVPAISEKPEDTTSTTLRQRLEKHRADPNCAVCHIRMDAMGFSLENFDPVGVVRQREGFRLIDNSAQLPDGQTITGADGLKKHLLSRKDDFVRCLSEKMLTYALGRGIELHDRCTIRDICAEVKDNQYRFSSLIASIVKSDAFQKRRR